MTSHKDLERAERELDNWLAGEGREDFITGIASLIAQVRNETLDAVDKMIEAQAAFYFSFSNELDDYESKLAQSHFDMAKRIRNLKQEDKEHE